MFSFRMVRTTVQRTMSLEMRQGSVFKPVWYSLSRDGLLTDTSNHLRDVDEGT